MQGITITCFAASYAVSLLLEISRLFFRARIRSIVMRGFAIAGLVAHSLFLISEARDQLAIRGGVPLSSWHDFCLMTAWLLAGAYIGLSLRRPTNTVGVFLLPLVLGLIGVGFISHGQGKFAAPLALDLWRLAHGAALTLGTATVTLGFSTGLMYLVQAYRLKHKLPPRQGFRLPSLEWLERFNSESLVISTCLLALGLVSGVVLNLGRSADQTLLWTDPVVLSSAVLFAWLMIMLIFELIYKPARHGKKVAYLTVGNFLFLILTLGFVLSGEHATAPTNETAQTERTKLRVERPQSSQGRGRGDGSS